jgi:magnesium transporter
LHNSGPMQQPSKLPFLKTTLDQAPEQLEDALSEVHAEDIAAVLSEELTVEEAAQVVARLPVEQAAAVLERLPEDLRVTLIGQLAPQDSAEMITEMAADDRADLMNELPDTLRESILSELQKNEPEVAEETRVLASYGEDTAAGIMTTEYIALGPGMSCEKAIAEVRRLAREQEPELIYTLYVVETGRLVGVLSLRDLILGEPSAPISIYMNDGIVKVLPDTDQEEVARTIARYDLAAVPVVDEQGQLLGVVTVDDVVDVVMEEADEDAQKMGGMEALDLPYLETRLRDMIRKRAGWLAVLFLGEMLTASAMSRYEDEIAKAVVLALFVPLIISVIRAMAVGHVRLSDFWRIAGREFVAGLTLGLILAVIGAIRIVVWEQLFHSYGPHYGSVAFVVAVSLVGVVMWGTLAGSMLPFAIRKCGWDPASASAPFVATLVDVSGLVIYFTVAQIVLGKHLL